MEKTHPFIKLAQQFTIRWHNVLLILLAIFVSAFEINEHPDFLTNTDHYFFKELALYYSLIIIALVMIELTIKAVRIKNQTINILDTRHTLGMQLAAANDWDETLTKVLQFPSSFMPVSATTLLLYNKNTDSFHTKGNWVAPNEQISIPSISLSRDSCCTNDSTSSPRIFTVSIAGILEKPMMENECVTTY